MVNRLVPTNYPSTYSVPSRGQSPSESASPRSNEGSASTPTPVARTSANAGAPPPILRKGTESRLRTGLAGGPKKVTFSDEPNATRRYDLAPGENEEKRAEAKRVREKRAEEKRKRHSHQKASAEKSAPLVIPSVSTEKSPLAEMTVSSMGMRLTNQGREADGNPSRKTKEEMKNYLLRELSRPLQEDMRKHITGLAPGIPRLRKEQAGESNAASPSKSASEASQK